MIVSTSPSESSSPATSVIEAPKPGWPRRVALWYSVQSESGPLSVISNGICGGITRGPCNKAV